MTYYECTQCGKKFPLDKTIYLCPVCGKDWKPGKPLVGVLEAVLDYEHIVRNFKFETPEWNLFSVVDSKFYPPIQIGNTPFFEATKLSQQYGCKVLIKFDGCNPSGSLKDRASYLMVAEANRLGEKEIVCASTGNAASALATICASTDVKAIIFVPKSAPQAKLVQMKLSGADVREVDGTYDDAFKASIEYTEKYGTLNRNTAYHPLTIEGKKTVAFEIYEQNGFNVPDYIVVPVGDGVIISAVYKGFKDLKSAGLIKTLPKLVSVQTETSNAINSYIETGVYHDAEDPKTIADSISVKTPSNVFMAARAIEETNGLTVTVKESEILPAQKSLFQMSGVFAEPAAAVAYCALRPLQKIVKPSESVVLLVTGHGLKDIESARKNV
ncbi:MAG: threonine synthase [Candidatus Zophobacter franzmannii]|nr:threonine synthase [Candidatus Zophobacter franzmannii]